MKGSVTSALLETIVVLAVLLLAIVFVADMAGFLDQAIMETPCQQTGFLSRVFNRISGVSVISGDPTDPRDASNFCPPKEIKVSERASDERIVKTVAEQMAFCHRDYGQGNVNLFETERGQRDLYCVLCAYVDMPEGGSGEVKGFSEYLLTEELPGKDVTYAQFFGGVDPEVDGAADVAIESYNISRAHDYAILFIYAKETSVFRSKFEAMAFTALGIDGLVTRRQVASLARTAGGKVAGRKLAGAALRFGARFVGSKLPIVGFAVGAWNVIDAFTSETPLVGSRYSGSTWLLPFEGSVLKEDLKCTNLVNFAQTGER